MAPCLVVDGDRIINKLGGLLHLKVFVCKALPFVDPLCNFPETLREGFLQIQVKSQLPVVELKSITFKQLSVVRQVIGHSQGLGDKSLDQAAPVGVILPEINGAGHGFITVLLQPCFSRIKKQERHLPIVYGFKKTTSSIPDIIRFILMSVIKGGNPAHCFTPVIQGDPTDSFTMLEVGIDISVESTPDLLVKLDHIVGIIAVQLPGKIKESLFIFSIMNRYNTHNKNRFCNLKLEPIAHDLIL